MFIAIARPAVEPKGPDAVAVPGSPAVPLSQPRALHARLLNNAALRRRRGQLRRQENRSEDADYWLHAALAAIGKAAELRRAQAVPLP